MSAATKFKILAIGAPVVAGAMYLYQSKKNSQIVALKGFPQDFDGFRRIDWCSIGDDFTEVCYMVPQELQKLTIRIEDGEPYFVETIMSNEALEKEKSRYSVFDKPVDDGKRIAYLSPRDFLKKDFPVKIITKLVGDDQIDTYGRYIHDYLRMYFTDQKPAFSSMQPLTWSEKVKVDRDLETLKALWPSKEVLKGVDLLAVTREADESMTFDFPDNPEIPGFNIKNKILVDRWFGTRMDKLNFATTGDSPKYSSRKVNADVRA